MKKLIFLALMLPVYMQAQTVSTVAGNTVAGYGGDGGPAVAAQLQQPVALAFDQHGNMYIADALNYRIRKVNTAGIITTIAGNGVIASTGDGGPATAASVWPVSLATDSADNIYVTETNRIRKINTAGIITTIAGDGTLGYNGDGIPATAAKLYYPYLGYVDGAGAVYFSDEFNHRIRKIDAAGMISTIYGVGTSGSGGDNGPATAATFNSPYYLYRSAAGDVYIPDGAARRTRKVDAGGTITAFAGYGAGGSGGGDGGPATAAAVASVTGVVCDDSGNVYLCMANANNIRKVNAAGIISTVAGADDAGYSGDGGPAMLAQFNAPAHMAGYKGNLYIADKYNNCIRKVGYNEALSASAPGGTVLDAILYPNPVTNEITISASAAIDKVEVINMAGQVVAIYTKPVTSAERKIAMRIRDLPAGPYAVRVNGADAGKVVKE